MILFFKILVWICGVILILAGVNDFLRGASVKGDFGDLGEYVNAPMLNYTIRFLGAILAGFGVLLIIFAANLKQYQIPLKVAFAIVILGGVGRVISILKTGMAEGHEVTIYSILAVELVLMPVLLIWFFFMGKSML